jgi:hypothetical protein
MVAANLPRMNQNVIVWVIGMLGLGFSEFYGLKTLYWISLIIAIYMGFSVCRSMNWYTKNYIIKRK